MKNEIELDTILSDEKIFHFVCILCSESFEYFFKIVSLVFQPFFSSRNHHHKTWQRYSTHFTQWNMCYCPAGAARH